MAVPYAPATACEVEYAVCGSCGEEGDFAQANDAKLNLAVKEAAKASVAAMLDGLTSQGISMAYFERALQLPARTLTRWKSGDHSAASLALLRVIRTYPWILDVADEGFTEPIASVKVVEASAGFGQQYKGNHDAAGNPAAAKSEACLK